MKLKIQDFISVGIYTAIYFVMIVIGMTILRFTIPTFNSILIPSMVALISGIVYLLLVQRVPRFGAITIMGTVMGIFFLVSGHFPLSFIPNIVCGLLADVIQYHTKLAQKIRTTVSYTVFSFGLMGPVLPLWFMKNAYVKSLVERGKDEAYINDVFAPITTTTFIVSTLLTIVCSVVGIWIGQKIYAKHFDKVKVNQYDENPSNV